MRMHLSAEDLDSFMEGNVTKREKEKIERHLNECSRCREKYNLLLDLENYLQQEEYLDSGFTERLVDSLNKNKYSDKKNRHKVRKRNVLKPVFSGIAICAFIGLAFWFGTKYNTLKNNSATIPDTTLKNQGTAVPTEKPPEKNAQLTEESENTPEATENKIRELGDLILSAFKNKDMKALASYVHPEKGVRFSPYTYVETEKDIVISKEEIKTILDEGKVLNWGLYDGSGEPIELTFDEYLSKFVYDWDFLNADEVFYDEHFDRGNTVNNVSEVYTGCHVLEYYFKGSEEHDGMDWRSLKLVFGEKDGNWYLVGVVHDQWTI